MLTLSKIVIEHLMLARLDISMYLAKHEFDGDCTQVSLITHQGCLSQSNFAFITYIFIFVKISYSKMSAARKITLTCRVLLLIG